MISCTFEDGGKTKLRHVTCSVIVLNKDKTQILLIKRGPKYSCPGLWAFPGGFMDKNENTQETAYRETLEETGYMVEVVSLFRIVDNPLRPQEDRQNVDFVFLAVAGKQIGEPDKESSEIKWFALDQVPGEAVWAFDHYEDLQLYLRHKTQPYTLPIIGKIDL